jgi:D-arabinose 1-dehydrogenase-like Zn-dependent alcohol dehydrogenase
MTSPTITPTPATAVSTRDHAVVPHTMRAIVQDVYGPAEEVLRLQKVSVPVPEIDQIVVRVHAASIHVGDLVAVEG